MLHAAMRLGRRRPTAERRRAAPLLSRYMTAPLPAAPTSCDNTPGAVYRMYANDRHGDCTIAALANFFSTAAAKEGRSLAFSDDEVLSYYYALSGGADDGLVELDVLSRATSGFPLTGEHRVAAWVRIDAHDLDVVKACIARFWAVYVGADLPIAARSQPVWTVAGQIGGDAQPGSWGGHAMLAPKYDQDGTTFITWGAGKAATWDWWRAYVDEAYALIDIDAGLAAGVDMLQLLTDLQAARAE